MKVVDHYEMQLNKWREEFKNKGRSIIEQHNQYPIEKNQFVPVTFFHQKYLLDLDSGYILEEDGEQCKLPLMCQIMIYSHLKCIKRDALPYNEMVALRDIKDIIHSSFGIAEPTPAHRALLKALDEHPEKFMDMVNKINGIPEEMGDLSVSLYAFENVKYTYIYWRGDDEFPSSLNILYEKNIISFLHPEAVVMVADIGIELMCRALGVTFHKWPWESGL